MRARPWSTAIPGQPVVETARNPPPRSQLQLNILIPPIRDVSNVKLISTDTTFGFQAERLGAQGFFTVQSKIDLITLISLSANITHCSTTPKRPAPLSNIFFTANLPHLPPVFENNTQFNAAPKIYPNLPPECPRHSQTPKSYLSTSGHKNDHN